MRISRIPALLLIALLFSVGGTLPLGAQSLALFEIDPSAFPTIRGKIVAVDEEGRTYSPNRSDLRLFEEGIERELTLVDCPPPTEIEPISSVLVLDVSSSMAVSDGRNLGIARAAAHAWIDAMALGISECAVTSFEERSFLAQDFTIDRRRLRDAVDNLVPFGGTGYNAAFLSPVTGAIPVAARGRHKRVVVFLTDGRGSGNEEEIVRQALAADITIHCVTVGLPAPDILRNVARRTGGLWFENVTSPEEAAAIYRTLLSQAQGGEPCIIEWQSVPSCEPLRNVRLEERSRGTEATGRYTVPPSGIASLTSSTDELRFGLVATGTTERRGFDLTAGGAPVTVLSVTSSDPRFRIITGTAPPSYTIRPGTTQRIDVEYTAADENYAVAEITVETEGCDLVVYAAAGRWGGSDGGTGDPPPIRLTFPNGGEVFPVGTATAITWTGVLPTDTVRLDYSIDAGASWIPVADKAVGLRHPWIVPNTPSFRCLARVTVDGVSGGSDTGAPFARVLHTYEGHRQRNFGGWVGRARFTPDGSRVATTSINFADRLRIWRTLDGSTFDEETPAARVRDLDISSDGSQVAVATEEGGGTVKVYSSTTSDRLTITTAGVSALSLRKDVPGTLATGHDNGEVRLWNADGSLSRVIPSAELGLGAITSVDFRPGNAELLIAGRGNNAEADTIKIYTADGRPQAVLPRNAGVTTHTIGISNARFSPDGSRIISVGFDGVAYLWDRFGGAPSTQLQGHNDGAISPDGRLAVLGDGDTIWGSPNRAAAPAIFDAQTGTRIARLDGEHTGAVTAVDITQIGETYYVVTAGADSSAVIWEIAPSGSGGSGVGVDESDDLWAIVTASITTRDIDFGRRNVGSQNDSVVVAFVTNTGDIEITVDSLAVTGADASAFSVVSGDAPFTVPARSTAAVELRFSPDRIGPFAARVEIFSAIDTLTAQLRGEGVAPLLAIETEIVDFGAVEIGDQKDTVVAVVLRNIGSVSLTITGIDEGGPDLTSFSILSGDAPFTIAPGATHSMRLRFRPSETGGTTGSLRFNFDEPGSPGVVLLFGSGYCPSSITRVRTILGEATTSPSSPLHASPGDTLRLPFDIAEIPVTGPAPNPGPNEATQLSFTLRLRYDRTHLAPLDRSVPIELDSTTVVAEFEGVWDTETGDIIWVGSEPTFLVGLGARERSVIEVDEMIWRTGCPPDVALASAPFRLDSLCREGNVVRLFSEGEAALRLALRSANPVDDRLEIDLGLIEQGPTRLRLIDLRGAEVLSLLDASASAGRFEVSADVGGVASGRYLLVLETPTGGRAIRIEIE